MGFSSMALASGLMACCGLLSFGALALKGFSVSLSLDVRVGSMKLSGMPPPQSRSPAGREISTHVPPEHATQL